MAYIKVECSVARNRKFVKAGPGPSWLWLCGLAYCQEGLTDGFIPDEALEFLGVRSARNMVKHLVSAGLWDEVPGGWQVHDYLEHNKSADEVADIRERRGIGGKLGGRPKKNLPENLPQTSKVSQMETLSETFPVDVVASDVVAASVLEKKEEAPAMDVWFESLKRVYPRQRVTSGHMTQMAFVDVLRKAPDGPSKAYARMLANLDTQIRGHEWRVKGYIPKLENWLRSGAWEQVHDEQAPVAEQLTAKSTRTLNAASELMREARDPR